MKEMQINPKTDSETLVSYLPLLTVILKVRSQVSAYKIIIIGKIIRNQRQRYRFYQEKNTCVKLNIEMMKLPAECRYLKINKGFSLRIAAESKRKKLLSILVVNLRPPTENFRQRAKCNAT